MAGLGEISLRPATETDVDRLTEIARAAYGHYVERMGAPPRPLVDDYAEVVRDFDVTVAEREARVLGLLVVADTDEGFTIENVAVDPAAHGTGIGRILLEQAETEARRAGFDSIALYTHETMTENLDLYARIGYVEYDRRDVGAGSLVYMRKPLAVAGSA